MAPAGQGLNVDDVPSTENVYYATAESGRCAKVIDT